MPAYLTEMLYRLCTQDLYSFYAQNKLALGWIGGHWFDENDDESVLAQTFKVAIYHYQTRGRAPGSIDALIQYVRHNPDGVKEFEQSTVIEDDLRTLAKDYTPDPTLDDNLLFDTLLATARKRWVNNTCKFAGNVAMGSQHTQDKAKESGPTAAIRWLRGELSKDYQAEAPVMAGMLHENVPDILQGFEDRLKAEDTNGRFPLGLEHIDRNVTVGKNNLKFLAILGMSGDGKTTLTNYICYNWLRQGAHVLYCSTEHSPREIWEFMTLLHGSHRDYDFILPSLHDWEKRNVTYQDEGHLAKVLCDIQDRKNLPGLLDCQQFRTWDAIVDYLTTNHKKNKYDCLIVDYLGRLDVPGDPRWRDQAMKGLVHQAQGLTRTFDDGKGLILLTPIQVNREANKRANNADEGAARYDLNAISQISEYQHDLDLCLSVWSNFDMRLGDQIEIQQLKKRVGRDSPIMKMKLDPNTGSFDYLNAPETEWEKTPDSMGLNSEEIGI